jgi:hypothetical protein
MTSTATPLPPKAAPTKPPAPAAKASRLSFARPATNQGHRVVLYGPGGIGKTSLACMAVGPVAFFDLDDSMPQLWPKLEGKADVHIVENVATWESLRALIRADGWDGIRTLVIDSATRAEEMAVEYTLRTVKKDRGETARNIEDYGYGKGYTHVYDTFLPILADLDQHVRAGRNVVLICHDCTTNVPNPAGEDWIRYEPRLQSLSSGKASIRLRVREWADHLLFIGYDVNVNKDGKATGGGSRAIYPVETPHCMAKSRSLSDQIIFTRESAELWKKLGIAEGK